MVRACLVLLCLALSPAALAQTESRIAPGVAEVLQASGEARVVVMLKSPEDKRADPTDLAAVRREVRGLQHSVLSALGASGTTAHHQYATVPALALTLTSPEALRALTAHPAVLKVDLDVGGSGGLAESVPLIRADERHAEGNGGSGVTVAVIDSGIDTDHADFAGRIVAEACFLSYGASSGVGQCPNGSDRQSGPGSTEDDNGHGTHVAGIVASGGVVSSPGVAPDAELVIVKVLNSNNSFRFFSEIIAALDYVSANPSLGIQVINMSLLTDAQFAGECDSATSYTMAGASIINRLRAAGVVTFASAGNNGSGSVMGAPACIRNVISVGATDDQDGVTAFSQSNATTDLFAPGEAIVSSFLQGSTTAISGTSMASPHAAGCAALLIESGDAIAPDVIEGFLEGSPTLVTDATNGLSFPRLDCGPTGALTALGGPEGYRTLAVPSRDPYDAFLGSFWTQGFPGSDAPEATCSAHTFDETDGAFARAYTCLPDQSATAARGRGFAAYLYEDDDQTASGVQGGFPKLLSASEPILGAPFSGFPLSDPEGASTASYGLGWSLLGNPLRNAVDWNQTLRTGLGRTIYVLDPTYHGGDWRTWTVGVGGDLPGGILPAFQGFFVRTVAASPTLNVPEEAVVVGGPSVYKRTGSGSVDPLRFEVSRNGVVFSAAFVAVTPEATLGLDATDAPRLKPLASPQIVLTTKAVGSRAPLSLNALPQEVQGEIQLPLDVVTQGFAQGTLSLVLAWSGTLPEGWTVVLVDRQENTETPVTEPGSYAFTLQESEGAEIPEASFGLDGQLPRIGGALGGVRVGADDRFALRITPALSTGTAPEAQESSGAEVSFVQPNPASRRAAVRVTLVQPERVRVSVLDALGREVVVAREGEMVGAEMVALDLSPLAAGVYAVRVVGESFQQVRPLTVVR